MKLDAAEVKSRARIEDVVRAYGVALRPAGKELQGLCPFHKEKSPSFSVTVEKQLFKCFGCDAGGDVFEFVARMEATDFAGAVQEVAERVGMADHPAVERAARRPALQVAPPSSEETPAKPVEMKLAATYPYEDEEGALAYEVLRFEPVSGEGKKTFKQRRRHGGAIVNGLNAGMYKLGRGGEYFPAKGDEAGAIELEASPRFLYRLSAVLSSSVVVYVEGEKDVATVEALGFVATTNSGGAKAPWLPEYSNWLAGRLVIVMPDQDEPGKAKGKLIAAALKGRAETIVLNVPAGKDASDFAISHGTEALKSLIAEAIAEHTKAKLERKGLLTPREIIENVEGGPAAFLDPLSRGAGLSTGFHSLDQLFAGGWRPGQLIILAARPAMGKTSLALNIASNVAEHGKRVGVFSLEMSSEDLLHRMMCGRAMVPVSEFMRGDLDRDERGRVRSALVDIVKWKGLAIDDNAGVGLKEIDAKLAIFAEDGLDLVVIDYLQLLSAKGENREQAVAALSRGLKKLAKKYKVPVLALSQLSRATETRGGARPQLSDLRESGAIENDADIVAFIYREEYYKPSDASVQGQAEVIVAKHRQGPVGMVRLAFRADLTRFANLQRGEEAA